MNRRNLLKALAAGGVLTASGLWMPGQKVISIPSGKVFRGGNRILTRAEIQREAMLQLRAAINEVNANMRKTVAYYPTGVEVSGGNIA